MIRCEVENGEFPEDKFDRIPGTNVWMHNSTTPPHRNDGLGTGPGPDPTGQPEPSWELGSSVDRDE